MSNLFRSGREAELHRRIDALHPDAEGRWGRMTAHQAICHLSDSFKAILGDRPLEMKPVTAKTRLLRFLAFTSPMPWPKGVRTSAKVDAEKGGTPPGDFDSDAAELKELITRFAATGGHLEPHYVWGDMSRGEWGRYGYRHTDHHLRQFGV